MPLCSALPPAYAIPRCSDWYEFNLSTSYGEERVVVH